MLFNKKGISLIVLVITIIVMIILAGAVILSLSKNNPIYESNKAVFFNDVSVFNTELDLYKNKQYLTFAMTFSPKKLQADETSITYNGVIDTSKTINDIIPSLTKTQRYVGEFEVVDGVLIYKGTHENRKNWSKELGISSITQGEPKITISGPNKPIINIGIDVIYTVNITSKDPITTINLTDKTEVIDQNNKTLAVQPTIIIGKSSGSENDTVITIDITIKTDNLIDGIYKLKIKSGSVTNSNNLSNSKDIISPAGFKIEGKIPDNPIMLANPTTWTNKDVSVTVTYSLDSIIKEYSFDAIKWYTYANPIIINTNNTTIYARGENVLGNESGISTLTISNIDKIPPIITAVNGGSTSSSVTIKVTSSDFEGSGINESSYQYSVDNGKTWSTQTNQTNYTFNNLTAGTYECIARVADNAGNYGTSSVSISTKTLGNVSMTADPTAWTNKAVAVNINYPLEIVRKEYSMDGINWNIYTSPIFVSVNNSTVYARGLDAGDNQTVQASLTVLNIDKIPPTVFYGTNGGVIKDRLKTTINVSDTGGSGIKANSLQYAWSNQNITEPSSGWTAFTNGAEVTYSSSPGTHYLWIRASDNAGNNVVAKSNAFTLVVDWISEKGVNKPKLAPGMVPIKWNGSNVVNTTESDPAWYDYSNKQWANARTTDGSMWVWIPRYEYKIPTVHSSAAQTILVNFLQETTKVATNGYTVHPAFTFGNIELTGIWVAKFEASGTVNAIEIKPDVKQLTGMNISDIFIACRNMKTNTRYGWPKSGTGIDTHLIKNIEWGAVAYLSSSRIYGKIGEVWNNSETLGITGRSGDSVDAYSKTGSYYYHSTTGMNASTTGTINGIYDMSGGVWEYVAAYVNYPHSNLTTYGANLVNAPQQYKDLYISSTGRNDEAYSESSNKKGDAIYETSSMYYGNTSWYGDSSYMPGNYYNFFIRGGDYYTGTSAGLFAFTSHEGSGATNFGFRPVLLVADGL